MHLVLLEARAFMRMKHSNARMSRWFFWGALGSYWSRQGNAPNT